MDQMLDKQDQTIEAIRELKRDDEQSALHFRDKKVIGCFAKRALDHERL